VAGHWAHTVEQDFKAIPGEYPGWAIFHPVGMLPYWGGGAIRLWVGSPGADKAFFGDPGHQESAPSRPGLPYRHGLPFRPGGDIIAWGVALSRGARVGGRATRVGFEGRKSREL
jgi:hypothetical protein